MTKNSILIKTFLLVFVLFCLFSTVCYAQTESDLSISQYEKWRGCNDDGPTPCVGIPSSEYAAFLQQTLSERSNSMIKPGEAGLGQNSGLYNIVLAEDGRVFFKVGGNIAEKFGELIYVKNHVLKMEVLFYGNGGAQVLFLINEDGTLTAVNLYYLIYEDEEVVFIDDFGGFDDVTDVMQVQDEYAMLVEAVDIHGNHQVLDSYIIEAYP